MSEQTNEQSVAHGLSERMSECSGPTLRVSRIMDSHSPCAWTNVVASKELLSDLSEETVEVDSDDLCFILILPRSPKDCATCAKDRLDDARGSFNEDPRRASRRSLE